MDPEFAVAAAELGEDTEKALAKWRKSRPDLIEAMKEFTKLFGAEVESKAISEEEKSVVAAKEKLDPNERELVDKVLNDDRVIKAMRDPQVQNILALAQSGRHAELFQLLRRDPSLQKKIDILKETGLIRFES
jgi:hypothetical protein